MCGRAFCNLSIKEIKDNLNVNFQSDFKDDFWIEDYNLAPGNKFFFID